MQSCTLAWSSEPARMDAGCAMGPDLVCFSVNTQQFPEKFAILVKNSSHIAELPVAAEEPEAMDVGEPRPADDAMEAADQAAVGAPNEAGAAATAASDAPKQTAATHPAADAERGAKDGVGADADANASAGHMLSDDKAASPAQPPADAAQEAGGQSSAQQEQQQMQQEGEGSGLAVFCAVVRCAHSVLYPVFA